MKDERTLKMMVNYIEEFDSGLTPREIAEKYGLSVRTIYNYIGEIAEAAGRSRESLLRHPHDEHIMTGARNYEPVKHIDTTDFNNQLESVMRELSRIKRSFDREIKRTEQSLAQLEQEEAEWKTILR